MDKKVLEIHQVNDDLFNLPLEDYILTFDDGLYTQYKYIDKLAEINTRKIFFISTGIVCHPLCVQEKGYTQCDTAHEYFFRTGFAKHYMTWSQIREISKIPNCEIGGHSHFHKDIKIMNPKNKMRFLNRDTKCMREAFVDELGYVPKSFCFPYNYTETLYNCILQKAGFIEFFGDERLSLDGLLKPL